MSGKQSQSERIAHLESKSLDELRQMCNELDRPLDEDFNAIIAVVRARLIRSIIEMEYSAGPAM